MRPEGGQWLNYPMRREDDGIFAFTLDAVTTSCRYQVMGGGTWTRPNRITMVRRPVLDDLAAEVLLPAYMGLPEPRPVEQGVDRITAPMGGRVRLRAAVSGDVAEGVIRLFKAKAETEERTERRETVWFDDHLPPDAQETGTWEWVREPVFSGTRAHTFPWDGRPYGFRTRLEPLTVEPGESFFVFARPDPSDPPGRLTVRLSAGEKAYALVWDSPRAPLAAEEKAKVRYVSALPPTGDWHRLAVPLPTILGTRPGEPVSLDGLTVEVDAGRVHFDRAGKMRRVTRALEQTHLEPVAEVPMQRDPETGRWTGEVAVEGDRSVTVIFRNALGHASAAMKALPIVATEDRPPTVVCERPGKSLTLPEAEPVPLMVRAFDDFGLASVAIQTGPTIDDFPETRPLAEYERPEPSRLVMASLAPTRLGLKPGQSVYYRVIARDRKGQEVTSEPYRLGLAEPKDDQDAEATRGRIAAGRFLDDIDRMTGAFGDLRAGVREILHTRPGGLRMELEGPGEVRLLNAVGTPLTAEEIRDLLKRWNARLTDAQRRRLADLRQQTALQRRNLLELAEALGRAADDAEGSVYELPLEAEALRAMAERARDLADRFPGSMPGEGLDRDVLARLMALDELMPDQEAQLADLQRQLSELTAARDAMSDASRSARQQYEALLAQIQGRQMLQQMRGLGDYFQSQQEYLRQMRREVDRLRRQTPEADAETLEAISDRHQELDPEALELIRRANALLRERRARMRENRLPLPPAPWVPPGRREMQMPVEADTPETEAAEPSAGPDLEAVRRRLEELENAEEQNWWDQPVDTPPDAYTLEPNERYADRHRPAPPPGEAAPGPWTPRRMLRNHQDRLYQSLTANSNRMAAARDELSRVMGQLDQAMARTGGPQVTGRDTASLQQILDSGAARRVMGMLNQAALQMAGGQFVPQSLAGGEGPVRTNPPRPGMVLNIDLGDVPQDQAGTLYRLPPWLRQPLVEGMHERGPEAYQPLIDAYYRQLSEDVERGEEGTPPPPAPKPEPEKPEPKKIPEKPAPKAEPEPEKPEPKKPS